MGVVGTLRKLHHECETVTVLRERYRSVFQRHQVARNGFDVALIGLDPWHPWIPRIQGLHPTLAVDALGIGDESDQLLPAVTFSHILEIRCAAGEVARRAAGLLERLLAALHLSFLAISPCGYAYASSDDRPKNYSPQVPSLAGIVS